ncbi:hypothetical protein [Candidatus Ichthyocystis hellenicum]|uniref:hypothetical protein n=1 Tax=Candidatus Ichthyocystis hellenicum TaxID=1561003 RepID=UPI000B879AD6|nr:hypothetical protein [Candidatus Ichthyocystis hellenicum]
MSGVQESCQHVDDSSSLMDGIVYAGSLHQETGASDDFPSCSNNESSGQSLVSGCNELSGVAGDVGVAEYPSLKEIEDVFGTCIFNKAMPNPSFDFDSVMEGVVCRYGSNDEFCSVMKSLIAVLFDKFTSLNVCEDVYKQKNSFSSGLEGIIEVDGDSGPKEIVAVITHVAITLVMGIDRGCDFLLESADTVKKYLASRLGLEGKTLTRLLLENEVGFFVCSDESIKKGIISSVVSLLKDVSAKCSYFKDRKYCDNVISRSSLDPWNVGIFLRKIIVLLVLFPESLHPAIVHNKILSVETFDVFFTPEGRCDLNFKVGSTGDYDRDIFNARYPFFMSSDVRSHEAGRIGDYDRRILGTELPFFMGRGGSSYEAGRISDYDGRIFDTELPFFMGGDSSSCESDGGGSESESESLSYLRMRRELDEEFDEELNAEQDEEIEVEPDEDLDDELDEELDKELEELFPPRKKFCFE